FGVGGHGLLAPTAMTAVPSLRTPWTNTTACDGNIWKRPFFTSRIQISVSRSMPVSTSRSSPAVSRTGLATGHLLWIHRSIHQPPRRIRNRHPSRQVRSFAAELQDAEGAL